MAEVYSDSNGNILLFNSGAIKSNGSGGGSMSFSQTERISFAYNLVINSNGSQFGGTQSSYNWVDKQNLPYPFNQSYEGYDFKVFAGYGGTFIQDTDIFKSYMKFMTGSDYLPTYNANEPHDTYIYVSSNSYDSNSRVWKLQHTQINVGGTDYNLLLAFKVSQFPFALKEDIPESSALPKTIQVTGVADAEYHRIYFDIQDSDLQNAKALSTRVFVKDSQKNEGSLFAESITGLIVFRSGEDSFANVVCRYGSYDSSFARFEVILDDQNPQVDLSSIETAQAVITLY